MAEIIFPFSLNQFVYKIALNSLFTSDARLCLAHIIDRMALVTTKGALKLNLAS